MKKINNVLQKVRPYIQMHGGDVRLVSFENGSATLEVLGACTHCSLSYLTYNQMVGGILKEEIPEIKNVEFIFK